MNQLEVRVHKNNSDEADSIICMPLPVLRINPNLLPTHISEALKTQGISVQEIAALDGVEGTILDIAGSKHRIIVSILAGEQASDVSPTPAPAAEPEPEPKKALTPFKQRLTTEFIAKEIGWRTGHDLIYAACAHMLIVDETKNWDKDEIDKEIKEVSRYYKPFYSTNLTDYLQYLIKNNKIYIDDDGKYAFTPDTVEHLEDRLSEERLKKRL